MRKFINLVEQAPDNEAERRKAFTELADAQRDKPEIAMVRAQHALGGGVLSWCIEHVGDLTHRMAQYPEMAHYHCGYELVLPKVKRALRMLQSTYQSQRTGGTGFAEEHAENMRNNAKYYGGTEEEYVAKVRPFLRQYAEEHKKLHVYNSCQALGRNAAIALGEENWQEAERCLSLLAAYLADPETWTKHASRYTPGYAKINEAIMEKVEQVTSKSGEIIKVWRNPNKNQTIAALSTSRYGVCRGFINRANSDVWIWDANNSHAQLCNLMGFDIDEMEFIMLGADLKVLEREMDWSSGGLVQFGQIYVLCTGRAVSQLSRLWEQGKPLGYVGTKDNGDFGFTMKPQDAIDYELKINPIEP